jgi:hypothetical protein
MNYERLQERSRFEFARRVDTLRADFLAWTTEARATTLGLSPRQRTALDVMLTVLDEKQRAALAKLDGQPPPMAVPAFADAQATLLVEMTGAQEVWHLFRGMLGQLEDPFVSAPLKAALRVAGDCYTVAIRRARVLKALQPDKFRETPLVYLEPVESPATVGRNDRVDALSTAVRLWRAQKLPLPIVILPADYARAFWTFCALHHEVGHNLDQDLALLAEIRGSLPDVVPADQEKHWRKWSAEILADALGVVLGGIGFALSLGTLALMLGPAARYKDLDEEAEHPPLLLRVRLVAALLRLTQVAAHAPFADDLEAIWITAPRPGWQDPFVAQVDKVAVAFLGAKLAALKDRPLTDLNPDMNADQSQVEALAAFFLTAKKRPNPADPDMRPRLVASAAQLALWNAKTVDTGTLDKLHADALAYLDLVPDIGTLAVVDNREYLKQLTTEIDFAAMKRTEN